MRFVRKGARVRNYHDLPLFRFAAQRDDTRRLTYAERFVRSRMPFRPASTLRLYAELAGLRGEG